MLQIQRWDVTRDGVLKASRLRQRFEAQGLWVREVRFNTGAQEPPRPVQHDVLQVVLSGLLRVTIDGDSAVLGAGDAVFVPRGSGVELEVVGSAPVVGYVAAFLPQGPHILQAPRCVPPEQVWR